VDELSSRSDDTAMGRTLIGEEERKFGMIVRKLRLAKGFTQEAFADHLGIDRSYQGRIERGETSVTLHKIGLLATALGLKKWELLKKVSDDA
jgi:transcriptional regulator with XRE-family HTH domain